MLGLNPSTETSQQLGVVIILYMHLTPGRPTKSLRLPLRN